MECSSSTISTRVACEFSLLIERVLPFTAGISWAADQFRHSHCELLRRERIPHGRGGHPRGSANLACETAYRAVAELSGDVFEQEPGITHVVPRPCQPCHEDHRACGRQPRANEPSVQTP